MDLYDDLENYKAVKEADELRVENDDLKKRLEKSEAEIRYLKKEFDWLLCEHQKLVVNFSSLLKTARGEVARKADTITNINMEKDQMFFRLLDIKNRLQCCDCNCKGKLRDSRKSVSVSGHFNYRIPKLNTANANEEQKKNVNRLEVTSRYEKEQGQREITEAQNTKHMERDMREYKENYNTQPKMRSVASGISSRRKSMLRRSPKFSTDEETDTISSNTYKRLSSKDTKEKNNSKSGSYERRVSSHTSSNTSVPKERESRYSKEYEKTSDRYNREPKSHKRHSYKDDKYLKGSKLESPPRDKHYKHKTSKSISKESDSKHHSRKQDYKTREHRRSRSRDSRKTKRNYEQVEELKMEYKQSLSEDNLRSVEDENLRLKVSEPSPKRIRTNSHRDFAECKPAVTKELPTQVNPADEEPLSCQSPDDYFTEAPVSTSFKEVKAHSTHAALEDPRLKSKRYVLIVDENQRPNLVSVSSTHITLQLIQNLPRKSPNPVENIDVVNDYSDTECTTNPCSVEASQSTDVEDIYSNLIDEDEPISPQPPNLECVKITKSFEEAKMITGLATNDNNECVNSTVDKYLVESSETSYMERKYKIPKKRKSDHELEKIPTVKNDQSINEQKHKIVTEKSEAKIEIIKNSLPCSVPLPLDKLFKCLAPRDDQNEINKVPGISSKSNIDTNKTPEKNRSTSSEKGLSVSKIVECDLALSDESVENTELMKLKSKDKITSTSPLGESGSSCYDADKYYNKPSKSKPSPRKYADTCSDENIESIPYIKNKEILDKPSESHPSELIVNEANTKEIPDINSDTSLITPEDLNLQTSSTEPKVLSPKKISKDSPLHSAEVKSPLQTRSSKLKQIDENKFEAITASPKSSRRKKKTSYSSDIPKIDTDNEAAAKDECVNLLPVIKDQKEVTIVISSGKQPEADPVVHDNVIFPDSTQVNLTALATSTPYKGIEVSGISNTQENLSTDGKSSDGGLQTINEDSSQNDDTPHVRVILHRKKRRIVK